ncbi:MAG: sulfopyruvate decarboxylase subunit alpha [Arenicella sp.]
MSVSKEIVKNFMRNKVEFITTVPCKQLAEAIELVEGENSILHIPSNKEDEGMGFV